MTETKLEADVRAVLARQADLLVPPSLEIEHLSSQVVRINFQDHSDVPNRVRRALTIAAAALVLAGGVVGLGLINRSDERVVAVAPMSDAPPETSEPAAFSFQTPTAVLSADEVSVETAGQVFTPTGDVEVQGDPGGDDYTTLELTWMEHGVEMRIYLYFTSDGTDWWANEIRTYDGASNGEWISEYGEFFRSPLHQPFSGELDLGHLRIEGLELEAFTINEVCVDPVKPVAISLNTYEIEAHYMPGSGYGVGFRVLNTETCELADLSGVSIEVNSTDIAVAVPGELEQLPDGGARFDLTFVGVGDTIIQIGVRDRVTGALVDSAEMPVMLK